MVLKCSPIQLAHCVLLALGMIWLTPVWAAQEIRVGAAHFPPYTVRPERGADTGLLSQLLNALNQLQSDYRFVLVPSSIPRRVRDFERGRVDMMIFENPAWGWQAFSYAAVDMGLEDAEVFVARYQPDRAQRYFDELSGKRLALFSGYHYAFAGFNSTPKFLADTFSATLTYSHESNLLMVLRGRADIALMTRSNLIDIQRYDPKVKSQIMMSERVDQIYRHYALLRLDAPIKSQQFAQMMSSLRDNGQLRAIFAPYQIDVVEM